MYAPLDPLDVLLHLGLWLLGGRGGVNWCSGVSPRAESRGLLVGLFQIR